MIFHIAATRVGSFYEVVSGIIFKSYKCLRLSPSNQQVDSLYERPHVICHRKHPAKRALLNRSEAACSIIRQKETVSRAILDFAKMEGIRSGQIPFKTEKLLVGAVKQAISVIPPEVSPF